MEQQHLHKVLTGDAATVTQQILTHMKYKQKMLLSFG
jgi:hypothetical protein